MSYLTRVLGRRTPQSAPIPGTSQVPNSAGGFAWAVDEWTRLRRFLVLGSEGGSFYAGEWQLTQENAATLQRCIAADGPRAVAEIVAISRDGRAPRNDPAVFALAMAAGAQDERTRRAALDALPEVCRTGTHLFQFAGFVEGFRGWGRGLRRAVGAWYTDQEPAALAYQAVKYRRREGYTHRDLLRLAHPEGSGAHAQLFEWIVRGGSTDGLPAIVEGFARAQAAATAKEAAALISEYRLPREAVQPEHLGTPEVWEALLEAMPMTALLRNLATMTRVGVIAPGSAGTARALEQLGDGERLRRARVHPIAVLAALRTYASGHGARGQHSWTPVVQVIDALDAAFYTAFGNVEPAGKRHLLALDVSGSMTWGAVAGVPASRRATRRPRWRSSPRRPSPRTRRSASRPASRRWRSARASASRTPCARCRTCRSAGPTARSRCSTRCSIVARSTCSWSTRTTRPGPAACTPRRRCASTASAWASPPAWS